MRRAAPLTRRSIEIEEEYVRRLQRLGSSVFPRKEAFLGAGARSSGCPSNAVDPAEIASAVLSLPKQAAELAAQHATLVESLRKRVVWPLEQNLKEQKSLRAQHKDEMVRIVKAKGAQLEYVAQIKKCYQARCREKDLLARTSLVGLSGRSLQKAQKRLKKAVDAEQHVDADYRTHSYKLNELHKQWQSHMTMSAREFQRIEEARLDVTKRVLLEYTVLGECHAQSQTVCHEWLRGVVVQCDHDLELLLFVQNHGTGTHIPAPPAYTSFYSESTAQDTKSAKDAERSLSHPSLSSLLSPAAQSPHQRYASDSDASSSSNSSSSAGVGSGLFSSRPASSLERSQRVPSVPHDGHRMSVVSSVAESQSSARGARHSEARGSVTSLSSGNSFSGSAKSLARKGLFQARALHTFQAQLGDEISLKAGQLVRVLYTDEAPWWYGSVDEPGGAKGFFPANYVERVPEH